MNRDNTAWWPWRSSRGTFGQGIARKRLLHRKAHSFELRSGTNTLLFDEPSIIHTAFLDQEAILSLDADGRVSLHRPDTRHTMKRVLNLFFLAPSLKLHPLSDGESFCVGLPNGDFRVYSTRAERLSSVVATNARPLDHSRYSEYSFVGPKRRYHRNTKRSLWSYANNRGSSSYHHELSEILGWETKPWMKRPSPPGWFSTGGASWDFYETTSSILAASVDPELDCWTLLDHRSQNKCLVCCAGPQEGTEDITTACFMSENVLATLHQPFENCRIRRVISLWDLRMTRRSVQQNDLPHFPYNPVATAENPSRNCCIGYDGDSATISSSSSSMPTREFLVSDMMSAPQSQTLIITTKHQSDRDELEQMLEQTVFYDPIRDKVVYRVQPGERRRLVSYTPQLDFLVTCETVARGRTAISFFNVNKDVSSTRKRNLEGEKHDPGYLGSIHPTIEDRDGIRTRVESIALNSTGTAIAAGSSDGDIFLWDGGRSPN